MTTRWGGIADIRFRKALINRVGTLGVALVLRIFIPNSFDNVNTRRLGSGYGGWWVPVQGISPTSVCYSVGAGEDISFDIELAKTFGVQVNIVDPTPRAKLHFESFLAKMQMRNNRSLLTEGQSSEPLASTQIAAQLRFIGFGVWDQDTIQRFYFPRDPSHVSCSITNIQNTESYFEAQCYTLKSLMSLRGDLTLNLLKLDVEGAEHNILKRMLLDQIHPDVLLVEFDDGHPRNILATAKRLRAAGYRRVRIENRNCLLIRTANSELSRL